MDVEVPDCLVTVRLVMLPVRCGGAIVCFTDRDRDFLDRLVYLRQLFVRDVVHIFVVLVRDHQHMPGVVDPPLSRYESRYKVIFIYHVFVGVAFIAAAFDKSAKRADVTFWFVIKHTAYCTVSLSFLSEEGFDGGEVAALPLGLPLYQFNALFVAAV